MVHALDAGFLERLGARGGHVPDRGAALQVGLLGHQLGPLEDLLEVALGEALALGDHAEAMGAGGLGGACVFEDLLGVHHRVHGRLGLGKARLRAEAAVLGAPAGLGVHQRAHVGRVREALDASRPSAVDERFDRGVVLDLAELERFLASYQRRHLRRPPVISCMDVRDVPGQYPNRLKAMIEEILPDGAIAVEARDDSADAALFPEEEALLASAIEKRRREFATGRMCAHSALQQLGYPAGAILRGSRGEPLWPEGVVGSITHCDGYRAAAVARSQEIVTLGIDAEPTPPFQMACSSRSPGPRSSRHCACSRQIRLKCIGTGCCSASRSPFTRLGFR